eukprot:gene5361-6836_t
MIITLVVQVIIFISIVNGLSHINFNDFPKTRGLKVFGAVDGYNAGFSVSGAGDVNNDGFPDLIIGAKEAFTKDGITYIIFGHDSAFNFSDINLSTMVTGPNTGYRLFGDGGGESAPTSAIVYVIYGNSSIVVEDIELSTLPPESGFRMIGTAPD